MLIPLEIQLRTSLVVAPIFTHSSKCCCNWLPRNLHIIKHNYYETGSTHCPCYDTACVGKLAAVVRRGALWNVIVVDPVSSVLWETPVATAEESRAALTPIVTRVVHNPAILIPLVE